jgi:hypothetical protein
MLNLVQPPFFLFTTTMRPISAAQHDSVVSLLNEGYVKYKLELVWEKVLLEG